jgi:hypothetical protein
MITSQKLPKRTAIFDEASLTFSKAALHSSG